MENLTKLEKAPLNEKVHPPWVAPGDMEHIAALVLATGLNVLPSAVRAGVIHQLSRMVGMIWYKTNRGTVRRVRNHLRVLFNYEEVDTELESLVRSQLVLASWNALVANLLPSLRDEHLADLCQIEGLHYVDEIQRQNEVVLLLGFHYGAYGYAIAATLAARGYPVRLTGHGDIHSEPPGTSHLYRKLYQTRVKRLHQRIEVITIDPGKKSQPELRKVLEHKNEIIYLLADQYFVVSSGQGCPSHLVPLQLLNHSVYLDVSGIQLAKQARAQPLMVIPVKTEGERHQRVLIEPMEWTNVGIGAADLAQDLQVYLARLERRLLEYPALWRDLRRPDLLARMGVFESEGSANG